MRRHDVEMHILVALAPHVALGLVGGEISRADTAYGRTYHADSTIWQTIGRRIQYSPEITRPEDKRQSITVLL